jgi:hypothetical protein
MTGLYQNIQIQITFPEDLSNTSTTTRDQIADNTDSSTKTAAPASAAAPSQEIGQENNFYLGIFWLVSAGISSIHPSIISLRLDSFTASAAAPSQGMDRENNSTWIFSGW